MFFAAPLAGGQHTCLRPLPFTSPQHSGPTMLPPHQGCTDKWVSLTTHLERVGLAGILATLPVSFNVHQKEGLG